MCYYIISLHQYLHLFFHATVSFDVCTRDMWMQELWGLPKWNGNKLNKKKSFVGNQKKSSWALLHIVSVACLCLRCREIVGDSCTASFNPSSEWKRFPCNTLFKWHRCGWQTWAVQIHGKRVVGHFNRKKNYFLCEKFWQLVFIAFRSFVKILEYCVEMVVIPWGRKSIKSGPL